MAAKKLGSFTFVLHSHLPYVLSHGRWPHGTDWLNEAAAETYMPILAALEKLIDEGISPKLTLGITPVLTEMLRAPSFVYEFNSYLDTKIEAAQADIAEFKVTKQPSLGKVAKMWEKFYTDTRDMYNGRLKNDIVGEFAASRGRGISR